MQGPFIMGRDTFMSVLQEDGKAVAAIQPGDDILETLELIKDAAKELGIKSITIESATKAQLRVIVEDEPERKERDEGETAARESGTRKQSDKSTERKTNDRSDHSH